MKSHTIAFLVAALAFSTFSYQINRRRRLNEEAAVLAFQIEQANSLVANLPGLARSAFDGATMGLFAKDGIFTESKRMERETKDLEAARVNLLVCVENVEFYRNGALIIAFIAGVAGLAFKDSAID